MGILSLPALYFASNYSEYSKVFDIAYVNLNFHFVVLIIGVFALDLFFLSKSISFFDFFWSLSLVSLDRLCVLKLPHPLNKDANIHNQ